MPKRFDVDRTEKYIKMSDIPERTTLFSYYTLALRLPYIVMHFATSVVKHKQQESDWSLYKLETRKGNPFIVREMCDRCGKVYIYPAWRRIRVYEDAELGKVYLETGVCKDCINASVYVDAYLDGNPLSEEEAKKLFYQYAVEYERKWRLVIAAAPKIIMTEKEWLKACAFFNGCALCGGPIEARAKYFPKYLNGDHTAWNILPMCDDCLHRHYAGRVTKNKEIYRYKIFSTPEFFNKTKTARMYLLQQMRIHELYMDPIQPFIVRFKETKILRGSE